MEDNEGASHQQSLGDDFKTHRYSFDVTPADGSAIRKFPFGTYPYVPLKKKVTFQRRVHDRSVYLSYAIGGPAFADIEAENSTGKPMSIFRGREYRCKRLRTICNEEYVETLGQFSFLARFYDRRKGFRRERHMHCID